MKKNTVKVEWNERGIFSKKREAKFVAKKKIYSDCEILSIINRLHYANYFRQKYIKKLIIFQCQQLINALELPGRFFFL